MSANPIQHRRVLAITPQPALRSLAIEWGVSRRALGTLSPAGRSVLLTVRYEASPGQPESISIFDPSSGAQSTLPASLIESCSVPQIRVAGDRVHVQSPLLYAFISIEHERPELLYARTGVFGMLQIQGGRYQPQGVRVETQH